MTKVQNASEFKKQIITLIVAYNYKIFCRKLWVVEFIKDFITTYTQVPGCANMGEETPNSQ